MSAAAASVICVIRIFIATTVSCERREGYLDQLTVSGDLPGPLQLQARADRTRRTQAVFRVSVHLFRQIEKSAKNNEKLDDTIYMVENVLLFRWVRREHVHCRLTCSDHSFKPVLVLDHLLLGLGLGLDPGLARLRHLVVVLRRSPSVGQES